MDWIRRDFTDLLVPAPCCMPKSGTSSRCPVTHPTWPWTPPRMGHPQPLWAGEWETPSENLPLWHHLGDCSLQRQRPDNIHVQDSGWASRRQQTHQPRLQACLFGDVQSVRWKWSSRTSSGEHEANQQQEGKKRWKKLAVPRLLPSLLRTWTKTNANTSLCRLESLCRSSHLQENNLRFYSYCSADTVSAGWSTTGPQGWISQTTIANTLKTFKYKYDGSEINTAHPLWSHCFHRVKVQHPFLT